MCRLTPRSLSRPKTSRASAVGRRAAASTPTRRARRTRCRSSGRASVHTRRWCAAALRGFRLRRPGRPCSRGRSRRHGRWGQGRRPGACGGEASTRVERRREGGCAADAVVIRRAGGLCPHRMHGLVIIRRPAWRLGPVGAGRRNDTPRRTEPASRRRPSTSDTATPGRRSPPPRGPRLTGRATW